MKNFKFNILLIGVSIFLNSLFVNSQSITWKKMTSLPEPCAGGGAAVLNDAIYFNACSHAPKTESTEFYRFVISTNTWEELANMPESRGFSAFTESSGKIYAIGGNFTNTNYIYNPEDNVWDSLASMPTARGHIDCGTVDNKIYAIGGVTSWSAITTQNEIYDIDKNTWLEGAPIPSLRNNPAIVSIDSLIYVIGGAGSETDIWKTIKTVECYNTITNVWAKKSELPFAIFDPGAVVVGNKIVVLGGQNTLGKSIESVLIYDIENDSWKSTTPLPKINCAAGYAAIGNKIYVIGGTTSAPDWRYYADVYEGTLIDNPINSVEENLDIEIRIYPNPASESIRIKGLNNILANYRIVDIAGNVMKHGMLESKEINIIGLKEGIYFLKLFLDKQLSINRFVVTH